MTNAVRIPRLLCLCVLLLFVAVSRAWALDPSQPMSSYIRDHFTFENGLPSNIVDQIMQSGDGFLLLVAAGNLARFDGRHFYEFHQSELISAMALAEDGDLWVGTDKDLEKIPAAALNQSGHVSATSYHPDPGKSSLIAGFHIAGDG